ncbi:MAG: hypothetical protein COA82_03450 [Alkaliphilus sp.]|nr:MAG: hypothetical protein COA82_03450 [Alkaliphilus sp.]
MIVFLTTRNIKLEGVRIIKDPTKFESVIHQIYNHCELKYDRIIGMDYETTGLDAYRDTPLLLALGSPKYQVVIDTVSVDWSSYLTEDHKEFTYLAFQAKFEYKFSEANYGLKLQKWFDPMIADQRIWQNIKLEHNIVAVILRYLDYLPPHMLKEIRNDFIGVDPEKFFPKKVHVEYVAADIIALHDLREKQLEKIEEFELGFLIDTIAMPLIPCLGEMELVGYVLNEKQLLEANEENIAIHYNILLSLDNEVTMLRDKLFKKQTRDWLALVGGKYTHKRAFQIKAKQYSLFDFDADGNNKAVTVGKPKVYLANTNYNSSPQIKKIFGLLKQPMPTKDFKYLTPIVDMTTGKVKDNVGLNATGKEKTHGGFTAGKPALIEYSVKFPTAKMSLFNLMLIEHNKVAKEISTYGESMVNKINPITGKIHSIYKQCNTANGRLASGGGSQDWDKFNQQNIPRLPKFRTAFGTDEDRLIGTADLSGAEVTICCSKAQDHTLHEMVKNGDTHSPIITAAWRAIYFFRAGKVAGLWKNYYEYDKRGFGSASELSNHSNGVVQELYHLSQTFVVDKGNNPAFRQAGKNGTFGTIYGMGKKTSAKTYNGTTTELRKKNPKAKAVNVTVDEGQVVIDAIKGMIPDTFEYVEGNTRIAFDQGYLVLNPRTKSRVWFNDVLLIYNAIEQAKKEIKTRFGIDATITNFNNGTYTLCTGDTFEMKFNEYRSVDGAARNIPISGTQADMLKEAMVISHQIVRRDGFDIRQLGQVHDEMIFDFLAVERYREIKVNYKHINFQGELPYLIPFVMKETANLYLEGDVKMEVDLEIAKTWVK